MKTFNPKIGETPASYAFVADKKQFIVLDVKLRIIGVAANVGRFASGSCSSADWVELIKIQSLCSKKEKRSFLGNGRDDDVCYDKKKEETECDNYNGRTRKTCSST